MRREDIDGMISAIGLGLLTASCCIVLASWTDTGSFRTEYYWDVLFPNAVKITALLVVITPLLLLRFLQWRYSLINLPLYLLLYVPLRSIYGDSFERIIPEIAAIPISIRAVGVMILFWGTQSAVFLMHYAVKKKKTK